MASPYTSKPLAATAAAATTSPSPNTTTWPSEMRSVTPATNNTRYTGQRYASPLQPHPASAAVAAGTGAPAAAALMRTPTPTEYRNMTPTSNRFGVYQRSSPQVVGQQLQQAQPPQQPVMVLPDNNNTTEQPRTPSSTGLIRLSLKKPMGIVFEPMYDPHAPTTQRGVRICDLPRTGAAALSRKLQVGDELLQINDTTVSRMTFDEIMDFIIEADPDAVSLLFRRPRKETLQARQGVQQKLNAAANKDNPSTVKWVDEKTEDGTEDDGAVRRKDHHHNGGHQQQHGGGHHKSSSSNGKKNKKKSRRHKKGSISEEEETISSTLGDESYEKRHSSSQPKKGKSRRGPYETESFLDLLIDTICSNPNNVCRDAFRTKDDEYSDDDETLGSEIDEATYDTYEESLEPRRSSTKERKKQHASEDENETEDVDTKEMRKKSKKDKKLSSKLAEPVQLSSKKQRYEDDGTLETEDSAQREKERAPVVLPAQTQPPLGLAPTPPPEQPQPVAPPISADTTDDATNPNAPIKEVEYDDRIDHGADVSVMESLGGPSLLIEKQRNANSAAASAAQHQKQTVPDEILKQFGLDYPPHLSGLKREQAIQNDPLKFYTHVVKHLLDEHEPEKVRLLDKLLAKYKGREDHLVQKLSVRYNREAAAAAAEHDNFAFSDAVKKTKASSNVAAAVNMAKDRLHNAGNGMVGGIMVEEHEWPEKEEKEPEHESEVEEEGEGEEESGSESEYSRDSVDGTSPAVIAQVSELLNYVYGKTSVPGQIDRVSTIMRAYEGREAVLLELLETKALIKANKEKENADNLPSFLRNSHMSSQAQKNAEELQASGGGGGARTASASSSDLPPVTPMAIPQQQQSPGGGGNTTVINDDISSMSGVSSPATEGIITATGNEIEAAPVPPKEKKLDPRPMKEVPKINATASMKSSGRPPVTPGEKDKRKKKGLFGGLFGKKKSRDTAGSTGDATPNSRTSSRTKRR